ncbi:hypothetical protein CBL_08617 [Carabus blaptoides fortunei]
MPTTESLHPTASAKKQVPVYRWDISFSSDEQGLSANAFLERVTEYSISRTFQFNIRFIERQNFNLVPGSSRPALQDARRETTDRVVREFTQSTREWQAWLKVVREFCAPTKLNYTFHHTRQADLRPHFAIRVFGQTIRGLPDSGVSRTAMGRYYWYRLKAGSYKLQISPIKQVTVANGARCEVIGSIALPIELHGCVRVINVLTVLELGTDFLQGIDYWQDMAIRARLKDGTWDFAKEETPTQLCSLETQGNLTEEERKQLSEMTATFFSRMGPDLGCTHQFLTLNFTPLEIYKKSISELLLLGLRVLL